jgi:U3 small nucleolar RNA-associated protein 6
MLIELKDFVQKGVFTLVRMNVLDDDQMFIGVVQKETKEIMKRRTVFETALVRRVSKKADFLRYAAYEMGLEQLRLKRVKRLSRTRLVYDVKGTKTLCTELGSKAPSVSDYALVRRQFHIFERALKKFKEDVGLWVQYIEVAKREGARALVGRITAR